MPDWIVSRITLTSEAKKFGKNAWYRLHIEGTNLSGRGAPISWTVPDVADPRFDLSNAVIDPDAIPFLGR